MDKELFLKIVREVLEDYVEEEFAEEAADSIYERCDEEGLFYVESNDYD